MASEAIAPGPIAHDVDRLDRSALAICVGAGVALFLFSRVGGWYIDDFENLAMAQRSGLTRTYLETTIFGHLTPGIRFTNWMLMRVAPMNYDVAAALTATAVALTGWLVYRILRLLYAPSPVLLALTSMTVATGMWLPSVMWWAGGSAVLPSALAGMLSCHALVRCYLGRNQPVWGVLAGVWMLVGLTFYERTLLGCLFGAVFLPMVLCPRLRPAEVLTVLRRAWTGYLALAVAAVTYAVYYLHGSYNRQTSGYTFPELLHFLWNAWSHSLVPGLFGGPVSFKPLGPASQAGTPLWWLVVTEVGLIAVAVIGFRRLGRRSLRGWVLLVPLFLAAQYAVATARLTIYGPNIGNEFRYVCDLTAPAVLALSIVLLRPMVTVDGPVSPAPVPVGRPAGRPAQRRARARRVRSGVAVFLVLTWTLFIVAAVPASQRWHRSVAVAYVAHLRATIAAADRSGPWSLYDTVVPEGVSHANYGRYSTTPYLARLVSGHDVVVNDLRYPMYVADPVGRVVPARLQVAATVPFQCGPRARQLIAPLSNPLAEGYSTVQLSYNAPIPARLSFAVASGAKFIDATGTFTAFPVSGTGQLTFRTRTTAITRLRMTSDGPGVCLTDVRIGKPVPAG